ncbi:hypothetical protein EDB81DRAFT_342213 [Dactylonectria macrodidyma]|uniref:Uncharacterized protein n=1 Tax=Dactylonectria macrodidyma TaxID=307937 RepID=A0A9P9JH49_9HYPO|nr:hypothetical protein EDB81DRAFT_342213 [Dactylonectria macrodidyma]
MHFSKLVLAILPALALASDEGTTTQTKTATLTKTYTLSEVHTVTSTWTGEPTAAAANSTTWYSTPAASTPGTSDVTSITSFASAASTAAESAPATITTEGAGSTLNAGNVVLAGFVGMVVVALM